jgi:hypothetical protein
MTENNSEHNKVPGNSAEAKASFVRTMLANELDEYGQRVCQRHKSGESLLQALDLPPESSSMLYSLAYHRLSLGQIQQAERIFYCLCLMNEFVAEYFVGYAICLLRRDAHRLASIQLKHACKVKPEWAVPHFHLCSIYMSDKQWSDARHSLDRFFTLCDTDSPREMVAEAQRMNMAIANNQ